MDGHIEHPPEIVKIEPLQGGRAAVMRQTVGIALRQCLQGRATGFARQFYALGEVLEVDMETSTLGEAEEQVDRALEQAGEDERPLREGGGRAEKFGRARSAIFSRRGAVADDEQEFATLDFFREFDGGVRAELGDLDQIHGEP